MTDELYPMSARRATPRVEWLPVAGVQWVEESAERVAAPLALERDELGSELVRDLIEDRVREAGVLAVLRRPIGAEDLHHLVIEVGGARRRVLEELHDPLVDLHVLVTARGALRLLAAAHQQREGDGGEADDRRGAVHGAAPGRGATPWPRTVGTT